VFARNLRVIRDKNFVKNKKKKVQWDREDSGLVAGHRANTLLSTQ